MCEDLLVDYTSGDNVFLATRIGIFNSSNGGQNWSAANNGLIMGSITSLQLAPSSPTTMYIAFENDALYKTTNALGKSFATTVDTWTRLEEFLACGNIISILVHPTDPDHVIALEGEG
jgi:hypothetical protein